MCSPGSTSNALLVKDEEDNDQDVLPVPKLHKDAVADAMDMDLTDWSRKWNITGEDPPAIESDVVASEDEQATAEIPKEGDGKEAKGQAEPTKRRRRRGGGGWQKRSWQKRRQSWQAERRDGAMLARQYRERVRLTQALHQAAQEAAEAYSPEALEQSRRLAIVGEAERNATPWYGKKRGWSQHTRADAARPYEPKWEEQGWEQVWEEQQEESHSAQSPLHPNPRRRIWPTRPPCGLQSKSKGCPPDMSICDHPIFSMPTPTTPRGPPPRSGMPGEAAAAPEIQAATPIPPPQDRSRAMQSMLASMAALLNP